MHSEAPDKEEQREASNIYIYIYIYIYVFIYIGGMDVRVRELL